MMPSALLNIPEIFIFFYIFHFIYIYILNNIELNMCKYYLLWRYYYYLDYINCNSTSKKHKTSNLILIDFSLLSESKFLKRIVFSQQKFSIRIQIPFIPKNFYYWKQNKNKILINWNPVMLIEIQYHRSTILEKRLYVCKLLKQTAVFEGRTKTCNILNYTFKIFRICK